MTSHIYSLEDHIVRLAEDYGLNLYCSVTASIVSAVGSFRSADEFAKVFASIGGKIKEASDTKKLLEALEACYKHIEYRDKEKRPTLTKFATEHEAIWVVLLQKNKKNWKHLAIALDASWRLGVTKDNLKEHSIDGVNENKPIHYSNRLKVLEAFGIHDMRIKPYRYPKVYIPEEKAFKEKVECGTNAKAKIETITYE